MDQKEIKTLMLMEIVEHQEAHTQRELAGKLNISLGLVNKYIQDLSTRGMIEVQQKQLTRAHYTLSRKGILERKRLANCYYLFSLRLYKKIKRRIKSRLSELIIEGDGNILLYGTGEMCEIACIILRDEYSKRIIVIDTENERKSICGIKVHNFSDIPALIYNTAVIVNMEDLKMARRYLADCGAELHMCTAILPDTDGHNCTVNKIMS